MLIGIVIYSVLAMIGWAVFVYKTFPSYMRFAMMFLTPVAPLLFPVIGMLKLYGLLTKDVR